MTGLEQSEMAKILVIEDEEAIFKSIEDWLSAQQHVLEWADRGDHGLDLLKTYTYDVVILDGNLPGLQGNEVCREFRNLGGQTPVLMLTARSEEKDKEMGLDSGADDYLTKPFSGRELCARIRALLRRPQQFNRTLEAGGLALMPDQLTVARGENEITLRPKEFALLEFLVRHPNQAFTSAMLLERVWNNESEVTEEAVRITIKRLRMKLGEPCPVRTVHGAGYIFDNK